MAQLLTNPLIDGLRGRFGGVVLVHYGDETIMRRYTPPRNPRTDAQQARRCLFADAVRSWQTLGNDEKARWNRLTRKGRNRRTHGYHLFIGSVLHGETPPVAAGTASFMKKNSLHTPFIKLRCTSVGAPSERCCSSHAASFPPDKFLFHPG